jgi:hypothetical protein
VYAFVGLLNSLIIDVPMHITKYNINSATSVNFSEEYVSNTLSTVSSFIPETCRKDHVPG